MTAHDVNANVRARFEAWANREEYSLSRRPCDSYADYDTLNAWIGYRAAHADLSGEVRELVEAATEIADNTENWDRAVIKIIGRQPYTGIGTERLRAALAACTPAKEGGR